MRHVPHSTNGAFELGFSQAPCELILHICFVGLCIATPVATMVSAETAEEINCLNHTLPALIVLVQWRRISGTTPIDVHAPFRRYCTYSTLLLPRSAPRFPSRQQSLLLAKTAAGFDAGRYSLYAAVLSVSLLPHAHF